MNPAPKSGRAKPLRTAACDQEQRSELTETLEIRPAFLIKLLFHGFKIGQTVSDDGTTLLVQSVFAV